MARSGQILVVLILLVFCQAKQKTQVKVKANPTASADFVYEPSWAYECIPELGCQRIPQSSVLNTTRVNFHKIYDSLHVCRTVCGRFGGLWPKPRTAALSTQIVKIHPNNIRFDLHSTPPATRDILANMTQVITANIMAECHGKITEVANNKVVVYLAVKSPSLHLTWDTIEDYALDVQTKSDETVVVNVAAETIFGVRHGLETFSQLIASYQYDNDCGLVIVSGAKIKDRPVFRHRGLLLDTSRHFIPMKNIKKTIDGMAATKMNVFHWHVTDAQSFPLESVRVPQLTRYGAYSADEIYTAAEVHELVEYAKIRGVRIVIEIDAPAHAGNGWQWGPEHGVGDLAVCVNEQPWRNLCIQPPCGQLNPANPEMYKVLRNLYHDIAELLAHPPLLHMGGDEVFIDCWRSSEEIKKYMETMNYEDSREGYIELWAEFHQKSLKIWDEEVADAGGKKGQPVMLWSSELTQAERISQYLDKSRYVIEVWEVLNSPLLDRLLHLGYRAVTVPKNVWYLDHGFWGNSKYSNWRRMYEYTPIAEHANLLGGEVAMWTEYVDEHGIDTRIWPRAAAVAERLWSNPSTGTNDAEPRLQNMRERLLMRGIKADVLSPEWCSQHAGRCV